MSLNAILDRLGDGWALTLAGLLVGVLFGAAGRHSSFCFRAATIEVGRATWGSRLAVWLIGFAVAVALTQMAVIAGLFDPSQTRQIANAGSLSGAIIGGAMFGVGMVLARGCASRLLILSATGNLRALVTGLILTIIAQASLRGFLSPAREKLAALWIVPGGSGRDLLSVAHLGPVAGTVLGLLALAAGIRLARARAVPNADMTSAVVVGAAIALGWVLTFALAGLIFEGGKVISVTFIGPSADTLMGLINTPALPLSFDFGLIPGVFAGSLLATLWLGEFQWQSFEGGTSMLRYLTGACLMGFGGMLAGGCAVGAAVTGTSIFALTGILALFSMALTGIAADRLIDRPAA